MEAGQKALQLTVLVDEAAQFRHRPVYTEIVHRAHQAGLAGATVLRGIEGYGASQHIHTTRILSLTEKLPVAVVVIDDEDRIRDFLPQLDDILTSGLVTLTEVLVIRPTRAGRRRGGGQR